MIRLSKLTDYAVTILSYMGQDAGKALWSSNEITKSSGLAMPTVAKIMKLLAKGELITPVRGASGGYRLAKPMAEITIAEIIESMDGPIAITDCAKAAHNRAGCSIKNICPMSNGWKKVNSAIIKALASVTLEDMTLVFPEEKSTRKNEGK